MTPFNVGVSILEPGFFKTNLIDDRIERETNRLFDSLDEETKEEYGKEFLESCM